MHIRKPILASALLAVGCASFQPLGPDEALIITTALSADWSWIGVRPERDLSILRDTDFSGWQSLDTGFMRPYDRSGVDINFQVPEALLNLLQRANRVRAHLPAEGLPPRVQFLPAGNLKHSYISVSRPAIADDQALVAVGLWPPDAAPVGSCSSGFLIYLERHNGSWGVVGYGALWIT